LSLLFYSFVCFVRVSLAPGRVLRKQVVGGVKFETEREKKNRLRIGQKNPKPKTRKKTAEELQF
jgi:hypothetical protein